MLPLSLKFSRVLCQLCDPKYIRTKTILIYSDKLSTICSFFIGLDPMRQVPYLIIGDGRLARHFSHYFQALGLPFQQWSRRQDPTAQQLKKLAESSERALILISDNAIEAFIQQHSYLQKLVCIHCSGSLTIDSAIGAHPLMTFAPNLYIDDEYQQIPFVIEQSKYTFSDLFPGLPNPAYFIAKSQKALYHSLCVLSGNFTSILWQKVFREFKQQLGFPPSIALPYLAKICENLATDPEAALTGPLARGDQKTLAANLKALEGDPFQAVYQAFVDCFAITNTTPLNKT